jgi:magnesium chelatase family protein
MPTNLATVFSRANRGIEAPLVTIEVHLARGMPSMSIVGLPETAVKESKDRVRSAIINSGFEFPVRRITINLAPADLPKKDGGRFDLAIAIGILSASEQIYCNNLMQYEFAGELGLNGELRKFNGALPFSISSRKDLRTLILPLENADEAALVKNIEILPAKSLLHVCAHLTKREKIFAHELVRNEFFLEKYPLDLSDISGQPASKRALEIAAAGGHSLLMVGPPGTGKTMLANRLITILPEMTEDEALETAAINSLLGKKISLKNWLHRPFRTPHHSASSVALVGGGNPPKPGEISLAHNGVLFLDELPEFNRSVLENLREPLESGSVTISRAAYQSKFPARFQLTAAMNPCPCGHAGDPKVRCKCTPEQINRYQGRLSGPFLDRIDLHIEVPALPKGTLLNKTLEGEETSCAVKSRVLSAQKLQFSRANKLNAFLTNRELHNFCALKKIDEEYFIDIAEKLNLSARGFHRILKIARTIADLANSENIENNHLKEALSYRRK